MTGNCTGNLEGLCLTRLCGDKPLGGFNRFAHSAGPGVVVEGGCAGWTLGGGWGAGVQEGQGSRGVGGQGGRVAEGI